MTRFVMGDARKAAGIAPSYMRVRPSGGKRTAPGPHLPHGRGTFAERCAINEKHEAALLASYAEGGPTGLYRDLLSACTIPQPRAAYQAARDTLRAYCARHGIPFTPPPRVAP